MIVKWIVYLMLLFFFSVFLSDSNYLSNVLFAEGDFAPNYPLTLVVWELINNHILIFMLGYLFFSLAIFIKNNISKTFVFILFITASIYLCVDLLSYAKTFSATIDTNTPFFIATSEYSVYVYILCALLTLACGLLYYQYKINKT